jgi:hypothetical protein
MNYSVRATLISAHLFFYELAGGLLSSVKNEIDDWKELLEEHLLSL